MCLMLFNAYNTCRLYDVELSRIFFWKKEEEENFHPTICMRVRSSSIHGLLVIRRAVNNVFVEEEEEKKKSRRSRSHATHT